jgi:hypothetical protein
MSENVKVTLQYYGISPWEIEVLYGFLNSHFTIIQDEIESNDEHFVSYLELKIPLTFNEEFFQWFDFKRWEKVKSVFKEMKRRRGSSNALKININFSGIPKIIFVNDSVDRQKFNNAVEKIDSVLELLQYHLDPKKTPSGISEINYKFDTESVRWRLNSALAENKKYVFNKESWEEIS